MKGPAALALLFGFILLVPVHPGSTIRAIRDWHLRTEPEPLSRVEVVQVPGRSDLVAAVCDYQREWWGFFGVYHLTFEGVDWQSKVEVEPLEQSIHRVRALQLAGFHEPIIEVFGITHMGNGNLYVYEVQGQALALLLETKAVDFNADTLKFRDGCLSVGYRDLNGDGMTDLVLRGVVEDWGEKGDSLLGAHPCRQVFLWDSQLRRFREDLASQEGIPESFD